MDGGKYSRAFSESAVVENLTAIGQELADFDTDFSLIQEVDIAATRSYQVDERAMLVRSLDADHTKYWTFAVNYDSPYLFYPILEPHGASKAGLQTFSNYAISSALRRSLPIQTDIAKVLDLDRCYCVNRLPAADGKELILINLHLSAYTTDPTIADQQLAMLYDDMVKEYEAGNYVICGGDFNKDLLGDSPEIFGVSGEAYSWAQPLPTEDIPDGFRLIAPLDPNNPVPSCRNADAPWDPQTNFQVTLDGFLVFGQCYRTDKPRRRYPVRVLRSQPGADGISPFVIPCAAPAGPPLAAHSFPAYRPQNRRWLRMHSLRTVRDMCRALGPRTV